MTMETTTITQTEFIAAKPVQVYDAFVNPTKHDYPPSRLEFRFEPKGERTEVTMIHEQVPASRAESYRQGWIDYYWTPLKAYFPADGPASSTSRNSG